MKALLLCTLKTCLHFSSESVCTCVCLSTPFIAEISPQTLFLVAHPLWMQNDGGLEAAYGIVLLWELLQQKSEASCHRPELYDTVQNLLSSEDPDQRAFEPWVSSLNKICTICKIRPQPCLSCVVLAFNSTIIHSTCPNGMGFDFEKGNGTSLCQ